MKFHPKTYQILRITTTTTKQEIGTLLKQTIPCAPCKGIDSKLHSNKLNKTIFKKLSKVLEFSNTTYHTASKIKENVTEPLKNLPWNVAVMFGITP